MLKSSKNLNQRGLTLVEVLAALVILGIVFIGIMTVFPQMTIFNEKTETKLDTMNLARQEMNQFLKSVSKDATSCPNASVRNSATIYLESRPNLNSSVTTEVKNDLCLYKVSDTNFNYEFMVYKTADLIGDSSVSGSISLHKVVLNIKKDNRISSETYGYLEYETR